MIVSSGTEDIADPNNAANEVYNALCKIVGHPELDGAVATATDEQWTDLRRRLKDKFKGGIWVGGYKIVSLWNFRATRAWTGTPIGTGSL